jgi:uncharacterized surface anchored protein
MRTAWLIAGAATLALGCGRGSGGAAATTPAGATSTTGSVAGSVRDRASGETLSFATVMASPTGGEAAPQNTDTTDAGGDFRIDDLAPGSYDVNVYYSTASVRWQRVEVVAGDTVKLDIEINTAGDEPQVVDSAEDRSPTRTAHAAASSRGIIEGLVLDQTTGEPLEGANVAAALGGNLRRAQLAIADAAGKFRIVGLPIGTYKLSVFYRLIDYGDIEVVISNIGVTGGATTTVPIHLDTSATRVPN